MKTKIALSIVAVLALASASGALAAHGQPTKTKPSRPATHVRKSPSHVPAVKGFDAELAKLRVVCAKTAINLGGSFGSAGGGYMAVSVEKATGKASSLVGKQVAVRLLPSTKVVRGGSARAADLKAGDALKVKALSCSQGYVAKQITATPKAK